jgi:hypothetical protein
MLKDKNQYNVWCKWHTLKTVVLGNCYPVSFYHDIKNDKIRSALTKITEETLEDLEYYEKVLKDFGCNVLRPDIDLNLSIMNFIDRGKVKNIPRAPLQPRDWQFVLGNKLYCNGSDANGEFINIFKNYNKEDLDLYQSLPADLSKKISEKEFNIHAGKDWLTYEDYLKPNYFEKIKPEIKEEYKNRIKNLTLPSPPSTTLVGKDLYIDYREQNISNQVIEYLKKNHTDIRFNTLNIGGHNDGSFHTLKPGVILSLYEIQQYEKTFPNWDICYLPNQSWDLIEGFIKIKNKVNGKWWVPGEENNDEFIQFVETWLNDWVGFCEESVFDVNVLMLDEHHVCVNNYNETAFAFFKKHKIEPIIVPWRHRYFWDGGLHCITLDLYREGVMEDYFPNRTNEIVDLGFD